MDRRKIDQKGGIARGKIERQEALERYYKNPNICLYCGKVIEVPEGKKIQETRRKKFCNSSCSAKYNNRKRTENKKVKICSICGKVYNGSRSKFCEECRQNPKAARLARVTKGQLEKERGKFLARASIGKHARTVFKSYNIEPRCKICGYDKYIEVCHIKPVKDFNEDDTLSTINDISNLVGLCPNHHKEYDNGLIQITF